MVSTGGDNRTQEIYALLGPIYRIGERGIIVRDDIKVPLDISKLKGLKAAVIKNYAIGAFLR